MRRWSPHFWGSRGLWLLCWLIVSLQTFPLGTSPLTSRNKINLLGSSEPFSNHSSREEEVFESDLQERESNEQKEDFFWRRNGLPWSIGALSRRVATSGFIPKVLWTSFRKSKRSQFTFALSLRGPPRLS